MARAEEEAMQLTWRAGMRDRLVTCECHVEGIRLTKFKDDDDLHISMWEARYYNRGPNWRDRLRHIWRIVRVGRPWDDELILSPEAARQVVGFILGAPDDASVWWSTSSTTAPTYTWNRNG